MIVECKSYNPKNKVDRDEVMTLAQKMTSLKAQKAMMFSTSGFQSGAIQFAKENKIALIQVMDGNTSYVTKSYNNDPPKRTGNYVGWLVMEEHGKVTNSLASPKTFSKALL